MENIRTRSPYRITQSWQSANPDTSTMELRIRVYRGYQDADNISATNPTHTLSTRYVGNYRAEFEISELIRDYIQVEYTERGSIAAWVDYSIFEIDENGVETARGTGRRYATEGYTIYTDGGYSYDTNLHMSPRTVLVPESVDSYYAPVSRGRSSEFTAYYEKKENGVNVAIDNFTITAESANHTHSNLGGASPVIDYMQLSTQHNSNAIDRGILRDNSDDSFLLEIRPVDCSMYTPYEILFINKFGAIESIWFFGNHTISDNFKKETYKADINNVGSYNVIEHQYKTFRANGQEMISINSGFLPEDNNETIKQLLMSEYVWLNELNSPLNFPLPVMVETSSFTQKTSKADKLINYQIQFKRAYDNANTI